MRNYRAYSWRRWIGYDVGSRFCGCWCGVVSDIECGAVAEDEMDLGIVSIEI